MTVKVRCPRCGKTKQDYRAGVPEGAVCSERCDDCKAPRP